MRSTPCPFEEGCTFDAVVVDSQMMNGAPMPVEVVMIRCPMNHWFRGDADTLLQET